MLTGRAASLAAEKGLRLGMLSRKAARGDGVSVSTKVDLLVHSARVSLTAVLMASCSHSQLHHS